MIRRAAYTGGADASGQAGEAGRGAGAAQMLWQAQGWVLPAGPWNRPVTRGELAGWMVAAMVRPAPEPLPPGMALQMAVGMGWLPPEFGPDQGPGGAGAGGAAVAGVPLTRRDLEDVEARVLGGRVSAGVGARAEARAGAPGAAGAGGSGEAGGEPMVTLAEAMPWFLRLLERAGLLFDGEGVVTAVDAEAGRVEVAQGSLRRVLALPPGAALFRNGKAGRLESLQPGDEVRWVEVRPAVGPDAAGLAPPRGLAGVSTVAVAYVEAYRWILEGTVERVDWGERRLVLVLPAPAPASPGVASPVARPPAPWSPEAARDTLPRDPVPEAMGQHRPDSTAPEPVESFWLAVESEAPVTLNGRPSGLAGLRPGDRAVVELRRATGAVRQLDATRAAVRGRVAVVDPLRGVLTLRTGSGVGRWVVGTAATIRRDGREARLADLRPGDSVWLALSSPSLASFVEVRSAE